MEKIMKSFRLIRRVGHQHRYSYDALMLRLHYQTPNKSEQEGTEVGQTLWLTTDVARQFISILEAGIAKIESGDFQVNEYRRH